ncbi:MAG TPA: OmpA family protein [Sphingomicrobium sp.]|nr:OmpA family protein [Sphingomicrobium sp.]
MNRTRSVATIALGALLLSGCGVGPFGQPGPPPVRPAAFTALGLSAAYLNGGIIGDRAARAKRMKAAGIRPLNPAAVGGYMYRAEQELRSQTAGIGIDVIRLPDGILVRVPAVMTFAPGSAAIKPQIDATLKEVSRTLKTFNQTYVDVLAHSDTSGTPHGNLALSQKRANAAATYLAGHGVAKARIAARGLGESAPLYNPETDEAQKAANRRVEIRLVPFRG